MTAIRLVLATVVATLAAPSAVAQSGSLRADAPRVLYSVSDSVKTDRGVRERITRTVVYDPVAGTTIDRTVTAEGRVLADAVHPSTTIAPTPAEAAMARSLVAEHPEIAPLIARARGTVHVDGGFPLVREAGHPCGPGGRCVMIDVFETSPGDDAERIRFVLVDLRALRVLDADADPETDTNFAHPAARRQSRQ